MTNLIDPEFVAWATQQRGAIGVTSKDIQPGNDDQRKAVFARLADEGDTGSISTAGDLHKHMGKGDSWADVSKMGFHANVGSESLGTRKLGKILKIRPGYNKGELSVMVERPGTPRGYDVGSVSSQTKLVKK